MNEWIICNLSFIVLDGFESEYQHLPFCQLSFSSLHVQQNTVILNSFPDVHVAEQIPISNRVDQLKGIVDWVAKEPRTMYLYVIS